MIAVPKEGRLAMNHRLAVFDGGADLSVQLLSLWNGFIKASLGIVEQLLGRVVDDLLVDSVRLPREREHLVRRFDELHDVRQCRGDVRSGDNLRRQDGREDSVFTSEHIRASGPAD